MIANPTGQLGFAHFPGRRFEDHLNGFDLFHSKLEPVQIKKKENREKPCPLDAVIERMVPNQPEAVGGG